MSTTQMPFSAVGDTVGEAVTMMLDEATQILRASTEIYLAGLDAVVEQNKQARDGSWHWMSDFVTAQTDLGRQVIAGYTAGGEQLTGAANRSVDAAEGAATDVARADKTTGRSHRRRQATTSRRNRRQATTPAATAALATAVGVGLTSWTSDGYDSLTAAEVVEKLPGFSQRDLVEVDVYERAHQARQTVLQRIESLRGPEPVAGYDELTVPEVQAQLKAGDKSRATAVRDYERSHKQREGVLHAVESHIEKA